MVRSNELNESMRVSLDPTIELNEQAGVVGGYIRDTLQAMAEAGEADGLAPIPQVQSRTACIPGPSSSWLSWSSISTWPAIEACQSAKSRW